MGIGNLNLSSSEQRQAKHFNSPNDIIADIYQTGFVLDREGRPTNEGMKSPIPHDQGMALYHWIRRTRPARTLEIGLAYGLSALFICQAHEDNGEDGRHIAIDPLQEIDFNSIGLLNIQRARLDYRLAFHLAPSFEIMPQLNRAGEKFDLIFIDGMHTFDYTLVDFFFADLLLNVGGYVIFDDIWMPSVRKVLMYVLRNRRYRLEPEFNRPSGPIWKDFWNFLTRYGGLTSLKANTLQFVQYPLDLSTFFYFTYFGVKGSLKYWCLRKVVDDKRNWNYHVAF